MSNAPPIFVLLATCNGSRYLNAQVRSLLSQRDESWRVLVRDDGSLDDTLSRLKRIVSEDDRFVLLQDHFGRLGSAGNFMALMRYAFDSGAQYFALCDQDDVWHADKLARLRQKIERLEFEQRLRPALVWSDLRWVDESGKVLSPSHFQTAGGARGSGVPGSWLLAMNLVPGCAMVGNRALLRLALASNYTPPHHDWWLALLASAFGHVAVVPEALVDYRQHPGNQIGAFGARRHLQQLASRPLSVLSKSYRTYWQSVDLARHLGQLAGSEPAHPDWLRLTEHVSQRLGSDSALGRVWAVVSGPVKRLGIARTLLMLLAALGSPPAQASRSVGEC